MRKSPGHKLVKMLITRGPHDFSPLDIFIMLFCTAFILSAFVFS